MNSESLTNVLTRQWRIVAGSKTVNPRNRMPESGASGSVGAPLEESGALPGNSLRPTFSGSPLFIPFRPATQALDRRLPSPWPRAQHSPLRQKNMQEQFFFYASVPVNDKRREHFEPSYRQGSRDDLNGPGYYANIFDTVENRLVWEEEFKNDQDACDR